MFQLYERIGELEANYFLRTCGWQIVDTVRPSGLARVLARSGGRILLALSWYYPLRVAKRPNSGVVTRFWMFRPFVTRVPSFEPGLTAMGMDDLSKVLRYYAAFRLLIRVFKRAYSTPRFRQFAQAVMCFTRLILEGAITRDITAMYPWWLM
jgi:hypothetical protein